MSIPTCRPSMWCLTLGVGLVGAPQTIAQEPTGDRIALVDSIVQALMETAALPSFSMAVAQDGRVIFARAHGWADVARRIRADTATRYRLASVSKLVTATAVGLLVQDGRLDLDAPLTSYVPAFPNADGITPRLLAGHLAGIGHYQREDKIDRLRHYDSVGDALATFKASPRVGAPGARYRYSTHGYTLLSAAVEGAAGMPFLDYLTTRVFRPLGMTHSGPELRADSSPVRATLYRRVRGRREPLPIKVPENPSYKWGGGGLISTPLDMVRLGSAYVDSFFSPEVRDQMWTPQRTASGESTGVGIGWRIGVDIENRRVAHHAGSMGGARSVLIVYPDQRTAIATTTNTVWASRVELNGQLLLEALVRSKPSDFGTVRVPTTGTFDTTSTQGIIRIDGSSGWVSTAVPMAEWFGAVSVDSMRIFHLHDDLWALVSPFGIGPLRLSIAPDSVSGVAAWSPIRTWRFRGRVER